MITYMDKSEIEALADAPLKTCKYQGIRSRDHVIILFMYNTGARVSEVIGVKVKDVAMRGFLGFTQTIYRQQVA